LNLQIIFQWHKLLHLILPIIIIPIFQKRVGLLKICIIVFITGLLKEIRDIVIIMDPLLESVIDMISNMIGILLGIITVKIKMNLVNI
jgi:hypothetical protein